MKKGFGILVTVALAAGLCSCSAGAHQATSGGEPVMSHAQVSHRLPICRPWTQCMV